MASAPSGSFLTVTGFGRAWIVDNPPALAWIHAVMSDDMAGVFPGLVVGDEQELFDAILKDPDFQVKCQRMAHAALGRAGAREWYWTRNLIKESVESWTHLNGKLVREGVLASSTSLPDWLDAAWTMFVELYDDKGRKAFENRLRAIPLVAGAVKPKMSSRSDLMAFAAD